MKSAESSTSHKSGITIITEDQEPNPGEGFYYVLSLTGAYTSIYTLYRQGTNGTKTIMGATGGNWDSGYRGNMGATLETATDNAIKYLNEYVGEGALLEIIEGHTNKITRGQVIKFGKYAGYSLAEIHAVDPRYMSFLCSEVRQGKEWTRRMADWLVGGIIAIDEQIFNARVIANRASSASEYLGTLKQRQEMTITCVGCKTYKGKYGAEDSHLFKFTVGANMVTAYGEKDQYE